MSQNYGFDEEIVRMKSRTRQFTNLCKTSCNDVIGQGISKNTQNKPLKYNTIINHRKKRNSGGY